MSGSSRSNEARGDAAAAAVGPAPPASCCGLPRLLGALQARAQQQQRQPRSPPAPPQQQEPSAPPPPAQARPLAGPSLQQLRPAHARPPAAQRHCVPRCACCCRRTAAAMAASSLSLGETKVSRLSRLAARVDLGTDTGSNQTGTPAAAACPHTSCTRRGRGSAAQPSRACEGAQSGSQPVCCCLVWHARQHPLLMRHLTMSRQARRPPQASHPPPVPRR